MIVDCSAVILAGGRSRRMGQDKASLLFGEQTLLQSVLATLQPIFVETIISAREYRADFAQRQILDNPAHQGPLGGLLAGLEAATTPWIFLVACDMPFISSLVIEKLAALRPGYQAVVPMVQGHPQPMAALYNQSAMTQIRAVLDNPLAKHSLRGVLEVLKVRYVEEDELRSADPQLHSFFDLDTPQDVQQAIRLKNVVP